MNTRWKSVAVAVALIMCTTCFTNCGSGGGSNSNGGGGGDGTALDSDGDGISNELELNGYTYDPLTDTYSSWDGDISKKYFKSDPLQESTDGDPYPDSMEVSGLLMDRSVSYPGSHPMVPGYPRFLVRLTNYEVTLNATITQTDGTVHQEGSNWNTDTYDTTTTTNETHWESSSEVGISLQNFGGSTSVSAGASQSQAHTTGTVRSRGGSLMDSTQWSLATSSNPSEAARIKLTLLAKNVGTCTAHDIELTMNVRVGGKLITTQEMAITIGALAKDETHEWVESDIFITYDELRMIETGAAVSVEVSQVDANVVKQVGGSMESVGTWASYMSTAAAVCANIFFDLGDGNIIDQMVYADDSPTSPVVTLRDAIVWAANGQDDPVLGPVVSYYTSEGLLEKKSMDGWYFSLDTGTYNSIAGYMQDPNFNLFDTVLGPNSIVVAKAPPIESWPKIRWANISSCDEKVTAYADDYFFNPSLLDVSFIDNNGTEHPMLWDGNAEYFYYSIPYNYIKNGNEKIVAKNSLYNDSSPTAWKTEMASTEIGYSQCRFRDMGNGTVRDNDTGLLWMKDIRWNSENTTRYPLAVLIVNAISNGDYGLTDGSVDGEWRLPSREEWEGFMATAWDAPALFDTSGEGKWSEGNPFLIGQDFSTPFPSLAYLYWSSTEDPVIPCKRYFARPYDGEITSELYDDGTPACDGGWNGFIWPVRDGD